MISLSPVLPLCCFVLCASFVYLLQLLCLDIHFVNIVVFYLCCFVYFPSHFHFSLFFFLFHLLICNCGAPGNKSQFRYRFRNYCTCHLLVCGGTNDTTHTRSQKNLPGGRFRRRFKCCSNLCIIMHPLCIAGRTWMGERGRV